MLSQEGRSDSHFVLATVSPLRYPKETRYTVISRKAPIDQRMLLESVQSIRKWDLNTSDPAFRIRLQMPRSRIYSA